LRSTTKSKNFQWLKLFPRYSLLWVPDIYPNCFNLHNTHQKSNCQILFVYFENENNCKTITGQIFRRGQKFRLTSGPAIFQIREYDSCSDSGYNYRSNRNLPMFLKWPCRLPLLPKLKNDSGTGFSEICDSGSGSGPEIKTWNPAESTPDFILPKSFKLHNTHQKSNLQALCYSSPGQCGYWNLIIRSVPKKFNGIRIRSWSENFAQNIIRYRSENPKPSSYQIPITITIFLRYLLNLVFYINQTNQP